MITLYPGRRPRAMRLDWRNETCRAMISLRREEARTVQEWARSNIRCRYAFHNDRRSSHATIYLGDVEVAWFVVAMWPEISMRIIEKKA